MRHDPDFTLAHPVIPFADCPEHVRELLGPLASPKRGITTPGSPFTRTTQVGSFAHALNRLHASSNKLAANVAPLRIPEDLREITLLKQRWPEARLWHPV
jgi:hypothetical protein